MIKLKRFIAIWAIIAVAFPGFAQQTAVKATAKFDSTHILVGDHLKLHLDVQCSKGTAPRIQNHEEWGMKNCEVLDVASPISKTKGNQTSYRQDYIVTAFDTGVCIIAPILIFLDDTLPAAVTDTLKFYVDTLPQFVDTAENFRDIKLPMGGLEKVPPHKSKAPVIIGSFLGIAALITLIILFFTLWLPKIKEKKKLKERQLRRESSGAIALGHIKELRAKELCEKGRPKEHYSELSMILRTYLDDQWDVNAKEMVTDEIMSELNHLDVTEQQKMELLSFFRLSDLVKYAKQQPPMEDNARHIDNVTRFVSDTDRREQQLRAQQSDQHKK
ncbi:MAG: hypothetical protein MJZ49_03170 [Bacteroidales bacterium]|nr:hypothetical protein [Bacteroidales bacterium]